MARTTLIVVIVVLTLVVVFVHYRSKGTGSRSVSDETLSVPSLNARAGPEYAYPNRELTPGSIDPTVTEENVQSTICVAGYTETVRPPERITHRLKLQIMAAYGRRGDSREYELDHFIPLELGGCPDCLTNLWPEPYDPSLGAKQKDRVENHLHRQVCLGEISLRQAQEEIRTDWVKIFEEISQ